MLNWGTGQVLPRGAQEEVTSIRWLGFGVNGRKQIVCNKSFGGCWCGSAGSSGRQRRVQGSKGRRTGTIKSICATSKRVEKREPSAWVCSIMVTRRAKRLVISLFYLIMVPHEQVCALLHAGSTSQAFAFLLTEFLRLNQYSHNQWCPGGFDCTCNG